MKTKETYCHFFENLSRDTPLTEYYKIFDVNVYFKDPIHEFYNLSKLYNLFQEMFNSFERPQFRVINALSDKNTLFLKWRFSYQQDNQEITFIGMSHVIFNQEGKAISHIDYWDAGENIYEKLPILGNLIRFIKEKMGTQNAVTHI